LLHLATTPCSPGCETLVCSSRSTPAPSPGCRRRSPGPPRPARPWVLPPVCVLGSTRRCPSVPRRQAGCGHQGRELVPARCLPRDAPPFGVFPSPVAVPRHRGRCPLAVQRVRVEPSVRVAAHLRSAHPRWRPQGLAPPSSPLLHTGSPLPAARRLRRALRRFSQVLHPILPWACVAFRALPRRSADWLPCLRTQRVPRHRGSAAVAGGSPYDCALPRTNRGLDALVGSRASPSTADPENRLRGARRDAARGGVWVVVLPATSLWLCESSPSPHRRRSCSVRSTGFPLPRPQHVPSGRSLPVAPPPSRPRHRGGPAGAVRPPCTEVWRERTDHRRGDDRSACSEEPAGVRAKSPRGLRGR